MLEDVCLFSARERIANASMTEIHVRILFPVFNFASPTLCPVDGQRAVSQSIMLVRGVQRQSVG
jgi:hypothetical protein